MTQIRNYFLLAIFVAVTFLIWSKFIRIQNNYTADVSSEIQKLKQTMHVENKIKIEAEEYEDTKIFSANYINATSNSKVNNSEITVQKEDPIKYILIWTRPDFDPLMYLGKGQETFIKKKCRVQKCFITTNHSYFEDVTKYDVILFNGPDILNKKNPPLPEKRSPNQNYVFASIESSDYYPSCDNRFDGYFNVSWTYKLNSDIWYGYIIIRDDKGAVIGPKRDMHWISIDQMKPINNTIQNKLSSKTKLAAWLVSNCNAPSDRNQFIKRVQNKLRRMGNGMTVDIYGFCGAKLCERDDMATCMQILERDYHFYFSFENSFAEDYVTEKILHPLQHYTVPVVYGTANYTRFLPDGIYLNALELGVDALAERMVEIVNDKEKYFNFFKWMNHYSFHYVEESPETDFYCQFCAGMNNDDLMKKTKVIQNLKEWWNPPKIRRFACPPKY